MTKKTKLPSYLIAATNALILKNLKRKGKYVRAKFKEADLVTETAVYAPDMSLQELSANGFDIEAEYRARGWDVENDEDRWKLTRRLDD